MHRPCVLTPYRTVSIRPHVELPEVNENVTVDKLATLERAVWQQYMCDIFLSRPACPPVVNAHAEAGLPLPKSGV